MGNSTSAADSRRVQRFVAKLEMELELMWHILPCLGGQDSYHLNLFNCSLRRLKGGTARGGETTPDSSPLQKTLSLPSNAKPHFIKSPKTSRRTSSFSLSWSKKSKKMPRLTPHEEEQESGEVLYFRNKIGLVETRMREETCVFEPLLGLT